MSVHERSTGENGGDSAWVVALIVLCLGIIGFGVFYSTNTVSDPAFLAGQYLVSALMLWGVFHAVFLRKRGAKINSIAFAAIFSALFASGLIAASQQKQQAVQALSSIQQEMARVTTATTDSSGLPTRIERAAAETPKATGDFGEIERFMKEFIDRFVAQRNDYLLELEAIGWNSVLDAQRVKNDTTLSESKVMIDRAKTIVVKYEKKTAHLMESTRERINALNMAETTKREMLAGFDKGMGKAGEQIDEQWTLEKQVVLQVENIFLLLAASKRWVVEDQQILFYRDEDLARFNSYVQTIQKLTQQQEQIQKSSYSTTAENLEALKNAAAK